LTVKKLSCLSQNNLVSDLKKAIESEEMINKNYQTRIWSHESSITLDIFFQHIITQCSPLSFDLMKIKALGKLLENVDQKLGDVGLE
jgi:inactivated superfamily I helicase